MFINRILEVPFPFLNSSIIEAGMENSGFLYKKPPKWLKAVLAGLFGIFSKKSSLQLTKLSYFEDSRTYILSKNVLGAFLGS